MVRLLLWDGQDTAKQQQDLQRTEKWQQMGSRLACDMSEQSVLIDMAEYVAAKSVLARATMAHYGHALIPDDHMEPAFTQCMTSAHESWL